MQTLSYPNGLSQKPGRSIATIALVGSLHLILMYAVLAALDIVPMPTLSPPTTVVVIPDKAHPKPLPPNPTIATKLATPKTDDVPTPVIKIEREMGGATALPPTSGETSGTPPLTPDVFVSASAIPATHTIPAYPSVDRALSHEGTTLLSMTIDTQGNVSDASVLQSSGYASLDATAIAWVKEHWRYRPATRNGNAVTATAKAEVTFRLTR